MVLKIIVIALLLVIIYSLGSGLFFMLKDGADSKRMVKALTWRISLSFVLFLLLLVGYTLGWIAPHGLT